MRTKLCTLTAITLLALTACGGGGSGSVPNPTQPTTGGTPVVPSISNKYADTVSGRVIVEHANWVDNETGWQIHDYQIGDLGAADSTKKDLNSFKITSGKTTYVVQLPKQGESGFEQYGNFAANEVDMGNNNYVFNAWGTNLAYARYGLVYGDTDYHQDPNAKYGVYYGMFHQGYLTDPAGMPTTGTVNYAGEAIVWNGQPNVDTIGVSKNASFTANFATKHFSGNIKNITDIDANSKINIPDIHLSGTIIGNKVQGINSAGTVMDAGFYGPNAAEVAGSFVNQEKVFEGAFGAKRTNK